MRYPSEIRWTGVAQKMLGTDYLLIEEGLNGRTTAYDDPFEPYRNGYDYLIPCLLSHRPLDVVVLFLGTNNLKARYALTAADIATSAGTLVDAIQCTNYLVPMPVPQILLISPPVIGLLTGFAEMFAGAVEKSQLLAPHYEKIAQQYGCHFLDAATIVKRSDRDGVHWETDEHQKFGEAIAAKITTLFLP